MKLSRTVAYALQATLLLAESDKQGPIPCSKLASQGGMPERFLLQVLRSLVNHGILNSTRGVDGGYWLGRSAEEISLLDVFEAIDGKFETDVTASEAWPPLAKDRLNAVLQDITANVKDRLEAVKVANLLT